MFLISIDIDAKQCVSHGEMFSHTTNDAITGAIGGKKNYHRIASAMLFLTLFSTIYLFTLIQLSNNNV